MLYLCFISTLYFISIYILSFQIQFDWILKFNWITVIRYTYYSFQIPNLQLYPRRIKIYYYQNQKLNNIYIYIIFRIKLIKEFTKIILPLYFSLQHPLTHSRYNRSILAVILLERNRIYTVQDWIRISMKWNDLARGIIRWTGIRKLSCIRLSMRTV